MGIAQTILDFVLPKGRNSGGGITVPPTYNSSNPQQVITTPTYRDHLNDLFTSRRSNDSRDLMQELLRHDPDASAALHGYLTLANTPAIMYAETVEGDVDADFSVFLRNLVLRLTQQTDYTQGFQFKQNWKQLTSDMRYMLLLRGAIGAELVYDKKGLPETIRLVDPRTIEWKEKNPGALKPEQAVSGQSSNRSLDTPTFFISFYRRDPTSIYSFSPFVSMINTISARQQVINNLYRIMQATGFPRIEITVLENILIDKAPANIKNNPVELKAYVEQAMSDIAQSFASIRADQAITHSDSVSVKILNEKNPSAGLDVTSIIETLNAQNQAGLKTMSTMLGRGQSGANTGSVEARIAAMFSDELNEPISEIFQKILSFVLHQNGFRGFAVVDFAKAELRPATELEPMLALKAARLRQDLSDGIISDTEYTLKMYGRLPLPGAPILSGTGFHSSATDPGSVNPSDVSPNTDPLGQAVSPDGSSKILKSPPKKTRGPAK